MSNSLAAVHPELIVEWSDRNLPLTPDSVTFGSNKKVDLCQYFGHKKLKVYADFSNSSSSFCCGVI